MDSKHSLVWFYRQKRNLCIGTYHNPISKSLNSDTGDGGSCQVRSSQMPGKHQGNEAEHVVEEGGNNGGTGENPEEPRLPPKKTDPPSTRHSLVYGQHLFHSRGREFMSRTKERRCPLAVLLPAPQYFCGFPHHRRTNYNAFKAHTLFIAGI